MPDQAWNLAGAAVEMKSLASYLRLDYVGLRFSLGTLASILNLGRDSPLIDAYNRKSV
jgi:hypothetical protein